MDELKDRLAEAMKINSLTVSELARRTGITKSSISTYLSGRYVPKKENSQKISKELGVSEAWLFGMDTTMSSEEEQRPRTVQIPVYESVHAGDPASTDATCIDTIDIPADWTYDGDFFAVKVVGDSMEPLIPEHSTLIVKVQNHANIGDIVVAQVDDGSEEYETTVKKYYIDNSCDPFLVPLNPKYDPIYSGFCNINILGKVVQMRMDF